MIRLLTRVDPLLTPKMGISKQFGADTWLPLSSLINIPLFNKQEIFPIASNYSFKSIPFELLVLADACPYQAFSGIVFRCKFCIYAAEAAADSLPNYGFVSPNQLIMHHMHMRPETGTAFAL